MDIKIWSARAGMELLFMENIALLRRNGLKWIISKKTKVGFFQIMYAIRPCQLSSRLENDVNFSCTELKRILKDLCNMHLKHQMISIKILEIIQNIIIMVIKNKMVARIIMAIKTKTKY